MTPLDRMPCPPDFVAVSILTALGSTIGASCGIKPKQKDDGWIIVLINGAVLLRHQHH